MGDKFNAGSFVVGVVGVLVAVLSLLGDHAALSPRQRPLFRRASGWLAVALGAATAASGVAWLADRGMPSRWQDVPVLAAAVVGSGILVAVFGSVRVFRAGASGDVHSLRSLATSVERRIGELEESRDFDPARYVPLKATRGRDPKQILVQAADELRKIPGGDPRILCGPQGSGKTVLLRHVAREICQRVMRERRPQLMALYIDLRDLDARSPIDVDTLRGHLADAVSGGDSVLAQRFKTRLIEALDTPRWLLLFDSFEELAAARPEAPEECLMAIRALCDSDSAFTAVVASRDVDIVGRPAWPLLTLAPLTVTQQRTFGQRAGLGRRQLSELNRLRHYRRLEPVLTNPLLLRLLCDHLSSAAPAAEVISPSTLVEEAVKRDLGTLSAADAAAARRAAEDLAHLLIEGTATVAGDTGTLIPLMSSGVLRQRGSGRLEFTNSAIRDHFAASWLMRADSDWDEAQVVTQASWRGAAIIVLQQESAPARDRLISAAGQILARAVNRHEVVTDTADFLSMDPGSGLPVGDRSFVWPPEVIHVLRLIVDGTPTLASAPLLPDNLRTQTGRLMVSAFVYGSRPEQQQALELLSLAPPDVARAIAARALSSSAGSGRLRRTAAERLTEAPFVYMELALETRLQALEAILESPQVGRILSEKDTAGGNPMTMPATLRLGSQIYLVTGLGGFMIGCYFVLAALSHRHFQTASMNAAVFLLPAALFLFEFLRVRRNWSKPSFTVLALIAFVICIAMLAAVIFALIALVNVVTLHLDQAARSVFLAWSLSWPMATLILLILGIAPSQWGWLFPQARAFEELYPPIQPHMNRTSIITAIRSYLIGNRQPNTSAMFERLEANQLTGQEMLDWFLGSSHPETRFVARLAQARPEVLQPIAETLGDLARALEHVHRLVPEDTTNVIPTAVWEQINPDFRQPGFRAWVVAYDRKYPGRLSILVKELYDDLSEVVQQADAQVDDPKP